MFVLVLLAIISICSTAYNIKDLSGFKCPGITKMNNAIRLNEKNKIECFSINGKDCATFSDENSCRQYIESNINRLQAVSCGRKSLGAIGSQDWCRQGRKFYFKRWLCEEETGLKTGIRIGRNGEVQCLSKNGRDCVWGDYGNKICQKVKTCRKTRLRMKSLSCGSKLRKIWGHNGYLFPSNHWCKVGFAFYFYTGHWMCRRRTGISTPVRLAINGDVECLSNNRRDCFWGVRSSRKCQILIRKYGRRGRGLRCGRRHRKIYRISGYRTRSHWCRRTHKMIYNKQISLIYIFNIILNVGGVTYVPPPPKLRPFKRITYHEFHPKPYMINRLRWSLEIIIRKYRRLYGLRWRVILRKRWGIYWYWRLRFGRRWRWRIRRLFGRSWRLRLKLWLKKFYARWRLRIRLTGRWSIRWLRRRYFRIYGARWRIILRRRWGIYWYWRLRFGVRWKWRLRRIYGARWQVRLRKWLMAWTLRWNFRIRIRTRGRWSIRWVRNRYYRIYGWRWRIRLRRRWGIYWYWRLRFGVRWRWRLRRLYGWRWRWHLRKWLLKWKVRWSVRIATTGRWSVRALTIRYLRLYGVRWRIILRRRWGIYWYWRLRYGARWRWRLRIIYGWRWRWHLRRWLLRWRIRWRFGVAFGAAWALRMFRRYGWGWRIRFRMRYGAYWRYRLRYGANWRYRIRILYPVRWTVMLRTQQNIHTQWRGQCGCVNQNGGYKASYAARYRRGGFGYRRGGFGHRRRGYGHRRRRW